MLKFGLSAEPRAGTQKPFGKRDRGVRMGRVLGTRESRSWRSAFLCSSFMSGSFSGCADGDPPALPPVYCGARSTSQAVTTGFSEPLPVPGSACNAVISHEAESIGYHVAECSRIAYSSTPPSSGNHYAAWAAFAVFNEPVGRGFWVHSLEHGAVAVVHNCSDCASEIRAAEAMIDALPEDPLCVGSGALRRVLMLPDPLQDVPWAAAAWRYTLRSQCFEPEVFRDFALEFAGKGPENLCAPGRDFP